MKTTGNESAAVVPGLNQACFSEINLNAWDVFRVIFQECVTFCVRFSRIFKNSSVRIRLEYIIF